MINFKTHLNHYRKSIITENDNSDPIKHVGSIVPGKVYIFIYNPINKKKLSYFDYYPLCLVTRICPRTNTFYGLNLHYVSVRFRTFLIDRLKKSYNDHTDKFRVNEFYTIMNRTFKKIFDICIKQYSLAQVRKYGFYEISPQFLDQINNIDDNTFANLHINLVHRLTRRIITRKI